MIKNMVKNLIDLSIQIFQTKIPNINNQHMPPLIKIAIKIIMN